MSSILFIKMRNEIKANIGQFLSIFVMAFIAMFAIAGLDTLTREPLEEYLEDTNYRDLELAGTVFTNDDINGVKQIPGVSEAEGWYTARGTALLDESRKMLLSYVSGNTISKCLVIEGEEFDAAKDGIWLDDRFFQARGLKIGDVITIESENRKFQEIIRGSIYNPEYLYYVPDANSYDVQYGEYGYGIMGCSRYPGTGKVYTRVLVDLEGITSRIEPEGETAKKISAIKEEISRCIDSKSLVISNKNEDFQVRSYIAATDSMTALMTIFPALFGAVAMLGIMSTMTRMIAKQRTTIGALKALGITEEVIHMHYILYSVVIVFVACVLGSYLGYHIVGRIPYGNMLFYYLNPYERMEVSPLIAVGTILLVLSAVLVTFLCNRDLLALPAAKILQPSAPKEASGSFIEKLPVWKKLKFATRWNIRDVTENKLRTLVSLVGIIITSMLLFAGFGYYEVLTHQADWTYSEQVSAKYTIGFSEGTDATVAEEYLSEYGGQLVEMVSITVTVNEVNRKLILAVLDEGNCLLVQDGNADFIDLPEHGILMTKRGMELAGAELGEIISFKVDGEDTIYRERVGGTCRVASNQGIYIRRSYWEEIGGTFRPTTLYTRKTPPENLTERDEIANVILVEDSRNAIRDVANSNITIIGIIVLLAVILGSVILYNLGSLAYAEKATDMATLKVLGFSPDNLKDIIMQQNMALTLAGAVLGIIPGKNCIGILADTMGDDVDCLIRISPVPYLCAIVGTFIVSYFINKLIVSKIDTIDMVQALKGE